MPSLLNGGAVKVETVSPFVRNASQTVSCAGTVVSGWSDRISVGVPAVFTEVYVREGDWVEAGQLLAGYRPLDAAEVVGGAFSGLLYGELAAAATALYDKLSAQELLDAAEVFAATGELPEYFKDFYLTDGSRRAGLNGRLHSAVSGKVVGISAQPGGATSGILPVITVEDTERLCVKLRIPEQYYGTVSEGMPVSFTASAFGNSAFRGEITEIIPEIRTSGGLIGRAETYFECLAEIADRGGLIPGITVRASVTVKEYKDAVVIPFETVWQDEKGGEYVFRLTDGRLEKLPLVPVLETGYGIVSAGFSPEDRLVRLPTDKLEDGMAAMEKGERK